MMKRTLENRIARLEKLLANHKSVKNESSYDDLTNSISMHLENALEEMRNLLALEKEFVYHEKTIKMTQDHIYTIQLIYEMYL